MEAARVLLIGRTASKSVSVAAALEKRYHMVTADSGKSALQLSKTFLPTVIVLDAVSMRTPGDRICHDLQNKLKSVPIVHLHPGTKDNAESPADVVLFQPFTTRKLTNAIDRLLQIAEDDILVYGALCVNVSRRILVVNGQEVQLTPKQALLMEIFLRHPGKTLDRKILMEKVWRTDYLGDTRTLDVHIRWIREVIEDNPSKPRLLKTVRGVGYRLEIPEEPLHEVEPEAVFSLLT